MADEAIEILSNQGWHVTKEGFDIVNEPGAKINLKSITQLLLDADIKDYGKPVLTSLLNNSELKKVVLQIQKIRNISAPKSNQDSQAAPRMLKLIVTDGHTHCQAIEIGPLSFLNHNKTPPGSKLLINKAIINSGYIFLDENTCAFLGGKVASLYEKWEINKSISKHNRTMNDGEGPPPWVSFGQKIQSSASNQSFKSLDNKQKSKESSEFDVQRQDAIAEASTGAVKKIFGGGIKQMQNAYQMKERRPQSYKEKISEKRPKKESKIEENLQKPPEKVSLFDFLENKLPPNEELPTDSVSKVSEYSEMKEASNKGGYNNYDKPKYYNQGKNTYQNQMTNKYQHNNYNYNQGKNFNYNFHQNRRSEQNYTGNSNNVRNPYYKLSQYGSNKAEEKKLDSISDSFRQMTVSDSDPTIKPTQHDKVYNTSLNKSTNERIADRISVNSEFASRSLRQHLNIKTDSTRRSNFETSQFRENRSVDDNQQASNAEAKTPTNPIAWRIGDQCMAKYWEDNKFYRATVTALTNRTCVVQFNDYGNYEEILHCDCLPLGNEQLDFGKKQSSNTIEFRRGGNRSYNNAKNFGKPRY